LSQVGVLQSAAASLQDLMLGSSGVYVPPTANFPKVFHNLGIRIEVCSNQAVCYMSLTPLQDEVLVGDNHPTILSVSAPKEVSFVIT
jgi:hypothetical protein